MSPGERDDRFVAHLEWMQTQLGPGQAAAYLAELPFSHRIEPTPISAARRPC